MSGTWQLLNKCNKNENIAWDDLCHRDGYESKQVNEQPNMKTEYSLCFPVFCQQVLNPFYIFQLFSVCLWFSEDYKEYAFAIIIMSIISIALTVYDLREVSFFHQSCGRRKGTVGTLLKFCWKEESGNSHCPLHNKCDQVCEYLAQIPMPNTICPFPSLTSQFLTFQGIFCPL